jgi:LPS export ABC transporter protein LptC
MIKQFFFMVCLIVITGSFLLLWESPPESFSRPDSSKIEELPSADSYMSNIKSFVFSHDGTQRYLLKASELSIFSSLSEIKLAKPIFTAFQSDNKTQIQVEAKSGLLAKSTQIFEFNGDVNVNWDTVDGETNLRAGSLLYSLTEDSASAEGGVQLTTPNTQMTGDTLSADFDSESVTIESRVRGTHESI